MENNMEIIENIMKPYFDKQNEIEKSKTDSNVEINVLKMRLEKLIDNKEREIEEYINEAANSSSNFYSGYGAMIRKDLELAYKEKEDELKKEIARLESTPNYDRVDLREIVEIKHEIRKQLYAEQKRLSLELKREQINFDTVMLELDAFKYEYNEQNQVTNGSAWREIYERSNEIADKIRKIREDLKKIEEYFKLTELTKEEGAAVLRSMTPWEKEEYDRRKSVATSEPEIQTSAETVDKIYEDAMQQVDKFYEEQMDKISSITEPEPTEVVEETVEPVEEPTEVVEETVEPVEEKIENELEDDIIEINDPVISNSDLVDGDAVVESHADLLLTMYNDIIDETQRLRSVRLNTSKGNLGKNERYVSTKEKYGNYGVEGIVDLNTEEEPLRLPCGEYVNSEDINDAINSLYEKEKGKTYTVSSTNTEYKITRKTISKFNKAIKKCSTISLVKDKKISKPDLLRVFGKEEAEKKIEMAEIGMLEDTIMPEGDYISRDDLISALSNLFKEKKASWLRRLSDKLKRGEQNDELESDFEKEVENTFEMDDDFVLKSR